MAWESNEGPDRGKPGKPYQDVAPECGLYVAIDAKREFSAKAAPILKQFRAWCARQVWPSPEAEKLARFIELDLGRKTYHPVALRLLADRVARLAAAMRSRHETSSKPIEKIGGGQSLPVINGADRGV